MRASLCCYWFSWDFSFLSQPVIQGAFSNFGNAPVEEGTTGRNGDGRRPDLGWRTHSIVHRGRVVEPCTWNCIILSTSVISINSIKWIKNQICQCLKIKWKAFKRERKSVRKAKQRVTDTSRGKLANRGARPVESDRKRALRPADCQGLVCLSLLGLRASRVRLWEQRISRNVWSRQISGQEMSNREHLANAVLLF